jgi:hypothetical protein
MVADNSVHRANATGSNGCRDDEPGRQRIRTSVF